MPLRFYNIPDVLDLPASPGSTVVTSLTTPFNVDTIIRNHCSTGKVMVTLPPAYPGLVFGPFYVMDTQKLTIQPTTCSKFCLDFTPNCSTMDKVAPVFQTCGKYLTSTTNGAHITLVCMETDIWHSYRHGGLWNMSSSG